MNTAKFLPQWGRGTMRSMVEGHAADRRSKLRAPDSGAAFRGQRIPMVPLHHPAGGPPPRTGEER
jgi:hypothetical protein